MKKGLMLFFILLKTIGLYAQNPTDSVKYSLLQNPLVQIETNDAIDALYNFEFEKSKSHFLYLKYTYPDHPLPHLLISLSYWWRIVPNYANEKWDELFLAYLDTTERLAKQLRDQNEIEGSFFLAAANAFRGRLYSERGQYRKAAFAGKNALKYLKECRGHEAYSPELLFGDALLNYYAEWIREEYPLLRPLMLLFPKGNKQKGIRQLREVARNAFYSRTEARYYLMRLLALEENDMVEGLQLAEYLNKTYPNNPCFQRFYARLLYQTGKHNQAEQISLNILTKADSMMPGYGHNTSRYASFFLGHINELRKNYKIAKAYYSQSIESAIKAKAVNKGYYYYALLRLGGIAEIQENKALAQKYYNQVKKESKRRHAANKLARKKLKKL